MSKSTSAKSNETTNKIMSHFNKLKRHNGDVKETESICADIAQKMGLDYEFVLDTVDMNRYENELPEETIDDNDN